MTRIHKKIVVVTGCSSGIGRCAALRLSERGYEVVATVRKSQDIQPLLDEGVAHVVVLNLADSYSIESAVAEIKALSQGRLFALFNNGAYGQPGAVEDLTRDALRCQFETNVFGTHELTIKLLPELLQQNDARIVQNSSILGFAAMPMRGAYNASKFALEGLTDTMRLELAGSSVQVSLIEPGPITSRFRFNALRALQENVDIDKSRHRQGYVSAIERLQKAGPASRFTLPADAVVKKLIHALESRRANVRYYVTFPTYLFAFLRHVLPIRLLDYLSRKVN